MGELAKTEQQVAARAHETAQFIIEARAAVEQNFWAMARGLHAFIEDRMHEPLGYDTLDEFIASPEVRLKRTQVFRMARVYRELAVERRVPLAELQTVDITKADVVLPAIKDGRVGVADALADAKALARRDLEVRYAKTDRNAADDPKDEPARAQCPECGGWYTPKETN